MSFYGKIIKGSALGTLLLCASSYAQSISFEKASTQLSEENEKEVRIYVQLSERAEDDIDIPIRLSGQAERRRDYKISERRKIEIEEGKSRAYFEVESRDDDDREGIESFTIELLPEDGIKQGAISSHTVSILDDEEGSDPGNGDPKGAPELSIVTPDQNVEELGQVIPLTFRLNRIASDDIKIRLTEGGTADDRDDYDLDDDKLKIEEGEQEVSTFITIEDDGTTETRESIVIGFEEVEGARVVGRKQLTININANDPDSDWSTSCASASAGLSYQYCITKTRGSRSKDILYFFHGAYGSEKDWTDGDNAAQSYKKAVRWHWQQSGVDAPTVVSVSLGSLWMLNLEGVSGAHFDSMANQVLPQIERQALGGELQGRRLIMGISMGGFNTSQLILRRQDLWDRAVLVAPLMPPCNPFLPEEALYFCVFQDPYESNAFLAVKAHEMVQQYFTPFSWEEANPLNLAKARLNENSVPTLLTSGTNDGFAFYTKNKELGEYGQQVSPMTWVSTEGEHGYYDAALVADFLAAE